MDLSESLSRCYLEALKDRKNHSVGEIPHKNRVLALIEDPVFATYMQKFSMGPFIKSWM
jgi:hypothetical protein